MTVPAPSSFQDYWLATREQLDSAFARWLPRFFDRLPPDQLPAVREVLAGGKRLRGCLVCLLNDVLGGSPEAAIPRALAVECVQAASLVHDDLVDGDTRRRHRAATWTTLGAGRAVLLGDLIFATSLQRMAELGRDDALALADAIATMAAGAYQEQPSAATLQREPCVDRAALYPRIISLKTGVLFGTAARLGAVAAGSPPPVAALAFEYGARIGEAYQMADDLQDLVEPAAGDLEAAAQLPLVAPALWHFCAASALPAHPAALTAAQVARLRPQLRTAMQEAIGARLRQASLAAGQLASGPYGALLADAPREIVRTMWAGVP